MKYLISIVVFLLVYFGHAQFYITNNQAITIKQNDSIKKKELLSHIGNGYFPTTYFNFDLRYLIKYNQYEGFRTGLGGVTNNTFSENFRVEGYTVYGFLDEAFKYSIGLGVRLNKTHKTWLNLSYTKDLQETGSSSFLTDNRTFQFFEPRLLNIELFHNIRSKKISIEHQFLSNLVAETELSVTKINPTYNYNFIANNTSYTGYRISMITTSAQWNPFNSKDQNTLIEGFPKFSLQYSKSIKNLAKGDFNFSKLDLRVIQLFNHKEDSKTELVAKGGLTHGNLPLSHSYHSYPNNVNKETIMQRFSVAGINSFETMFFNEFFSDRFLFFEAKHFLKSFNFSPWFKPQLVLITRYTVGDMTNKEKHQNINFDTLEKGYLESGFEINKLLYGFGLSFAYRYGAYHKTEFEDNFAFKFTFNINLDK